MTQVLVVEDDAWQAEHIERQLRRAGYSVERAAHGLAAIDAVDQQTPDVVLLDLMLPGGNGLTLLHELQSHADLAQIPVVVCSTEPLKLDDLRPYGVRSVLDKTTMTNADLGEAIGRALP